MLGYAFKCLICKNEFENSEIITLKCNHVYCWSCIKSYIVKNLDVKIKCPNCVMIINDYVIRQSLSKDEIIKYESLSIASIVKSHEQCFQCLLPECGNIVFYNKEEIQFECSNCSLFNCILCKATHPYHSCKDYQNLILSARLKNKVKLQLESDSKNELNRAKIVLDKKKQDQNKNDLKELDLKNLIPNDEPFSCSICFKVISKGEGVKLRSCFHLFCKSCLNSAIIDTNIIPVNCLETDCRGKLFDREVREILNEKEFDNFNDKSLKIAQSQLKNVFHCKKPDCKYFAIISKRTMTKLLCPACESVNCISCKVIHKESENCSAFLENFENNADVKSIDYIESQVRQGLCMKCPSCGCIIKKAGGCNWLKCPQCSLELCWILKIPRWGPKGKGDTSGGCKCGVDNITCDPRCELGCAPE